MKRGHDSRLREARRGPGRVPVALSRGSNTRDTYARLGRPPLGDVIDWPNVHVFWGDERMVPPDDPAALANAIDALARDPALRQSFAAAGRKMVEEEFSSARIGREIVALYDDLLRT